MVAESRIQIGNSVVRAQRWIETCPPAAKLAARVVVGAMPQLLAWTLDFWHWVSLCPCASLASKTSIADFGNMGSLSIERERLSFFVRARCPFGGSMVLNLTRGPAENRTTEEARTCEA